MGVLDGNIFEGMRIILPEHKDKMSKIEHESKKKKPSLTEDEMAEMQYTLSEALQQELAVRILIHGPDGSKIIEGIPFMKGTKLLIETETGNKELTVKHIVKVDLV